jgi:hypothetical protein
MFYTFQLTMRRWTKLVFVFASMLFGAVSSADASCNNHTFFSFPTIEPSPTPNQPTGSNATATLPSAKESEPLPCGQCPSSPSAPGDVPCRGPNCSGNNAPQGIPITNGAQNKIQETWSLATFLPTADEIQQSGRLQLAEFSVPVHRIDPIFHPPRHG